MLDLSDNREVVDELIKAKDLKKGNRIHLTVMGGDEYFTITEVVQYENDALTHWKGTGVSSVEDTVRSDEDVWIKKPESV